VTDRACSRPGGSGAGTAASPAPRSPDPRGTAPRRDRGTGGSSGRWAVHPGTARRGSHSSRSSDSSAGTPRARRALLPETHRKLPPLPYCGQGPRPAADPPRGTSWRGWARGASFAPRCITASPLAASRPRPSLHHGFAPRCITASPLAASRLRPSLHHGFAPRCITASPLAASRPRPSLHHGFTPLPHAEHHGSVQSSARLHGSRRALLQTSAAEGALGSRNGDRSRPSNGRGVPPSICCVERDVALGLGCSGGWRRAAALTSRPPAARRPPKPSSSSSSS